MAVQHRPQRLDRRGPIARQAKPHLPRRRARRPGGRRWRECNACAPASARRLEGDAAAAPRAARSNRARLRGRPRLSRSGRCFGCADRHSNEPPGARARGAAIAVGSGMMKVDLESLIAFADGELTEAERAEVQRALEADPTLRAQLETQQGLRTAINAAFDP